MKKRYVLGYSKDEIWSGSLSFWEPTFKSIKKAEEHALLGFDKGLKIFELVEVKKIKHRKIK